MDWTTPLRSQQTDFIQRLKSGCLLHCETQGQHSELTVISGERLKQLRDFCWEMADKYKQNSPVRKVFIDNMKGKLAEEVVQVRLIDLITEVDYEKRISGDGKVDFRLNSDPSVGIQVKSRHGSIDTIKWSISKEEVEKNAALVCILIQEEVNEAQTKYNLILAGFLPTNMIAVSNGQVSVNLDELLYGGGLRSYLGSLKTLEANNSRWHDIQLLETKQEREPTPEQTKQQYVEHQFVSLVVDYFSLGNACYEKGDYESAITNYNQALQLKSNLAEVYFWRGVARYAIGNMQGAIEDFNQGISINPIDAKAYNNRGNFRSDIGDNLGAIEDFNQATKIDPNYPTAYYNRGNIRFKAGDNLGAIEDFSQTITINPNYAEAYFGRGVAYYFGGDTHRAVEDFGQELRINPNNDRAYFWRGFTLAAIGNERGAVKDYSRAIRINSNFAPTYYNRGVARAAIEDDSGAIEDFNQAIKINTNYAEAYENLGAASFDTGSMCSAINNLQQSADLYQKQDRQADYQRVIDVIRIIWIDNEVE